MIHYVKEVIAAWDNMLKHDNGFTVVKSKHRRKSKSSAAQEDLFKVDKDAK